MNKRYQVFVSSTFKDLAEERMEVIKALLELDCIPCGMEYFPAASEDSWSYISSLIKQCDYYVLIVAGRYGSMTADGISFTQKEYQCALDSGVPVLAFVRADVESLPVKKVDDDPRLKKKLDEFVTQLKAKNLCLQRVAQRRRVRGCCQSRDYTTDKAGPEGRMGTGGCGWIYECRAGS